MFDEAFANIFISLIALLFPYSNFEDFFKLKAPYVHSKKVKNNWVTEKKSNFGVPYSRN